MKITILKPLGDVGIITEVKPFISDAVIIVRFAGENEGTLTGGQRSYAVKDGIARIPEYEILTGESKIFLDTKDARYTCGSITRNGRFLKVNTDADKLIISCAIGLAAQADEIGKLKEENRLIKEQYGVKIV